MIQIKNDQLELQINTHGAELCSIKDITTNQEYLWCGDAKFWGRHAPVLFPFVGSQKDKQYVHEGVTYAMGQHGFARDMEFTYLNDIDAKEGEAWFLLESNDATLEKYPFQFRLYIGYRLEGRSVTVLYRVENPDTKTMYFMIGAHPAFNCPMEEGKQLSDYYLRFTNVEELPVSYIDMSCGLKKDEVIPMPLEKRYEAKDGDKYSYLKLSKELFEKDALIIEDSNINEAALCKSDLTPYVTVTFDAKLFGLWSPAGKDAPFVCIEPWYGRCDAVSFKGELKEKEYMNELKGNQSYNVDYMFQF